jgi:ABC-type transport system involved in multi-copper enzyme maturation permease subunit
MGIADASYQPWSGDFRPRWHRIAAMVRTGMRTSFEGVMTKLVLFGSYSIVVVIIGVLYIAASTPAPLPFALGNNLYRVYLNSVPYGMLLMLLTAMIGSRQISRDLKYNATSMYFSKAITRGDYLAGKFVVVALFLLSASFLPSVLLWFGQLAMSKEALTTGERLRDLGSIFLHSLVIVVPSSAVILALSSLSRAAYIPGVMFVLIHFGSQIAGWILEGRVKAEWVKLVSFQNNTAHLGNLVYQERPLKSWSGDPFALQPVMSYGWGPPAAVLLAITLFSIAVVLWRLRKFESQE